MSWDYFLFCFGVGRYIGKWAAGSRENGFSCLATQPPHRSESHSFVLVLACKSSRALRFIGIYMGCALQALIYQSSQYKGLSIVCVVSLGLMYRCHNVYAY